MKVRLLSLLALMTGLAVAADSPKDAEKSKEALQELGEFIGQWKSNGEGSVDGKPAIWKETWEFGWKFPKDAPAFILVKIADAKFFSQAEVRYDVAKKQYTATVTDKAGKPQEYTGKLTRGKLLLERKDAKTGDVHKIAVNTAARGIRLIAEYEVQAGGKGLADTVYKVAGNKEGESFAGGGGNKKECIVTGGLGTIGVSFQGSTYYVCCSGCKEEFDANPKKYIDAAKKK
jgi:hypothetical protein